MRALYIALDFKLWLHVKNYFEIILKLLQCLISHVTIDGGYM